MRTRVLSPCIGLVLCLSWAPVSAQQAAEGSSLQVQSNESATVAINRKRRTEWEDEKSGRLNRALGRTLRESEYRIGRDRRNNEQGRERFIRDVQRDRALARPPRETLRKIDSRYQELETKRRAIEDLQRGQRMAQRRTARPLGGGNRGLQRLYLESLR